MMMNVKNYVRAKDLEEAYTLLNQDPLNKILGGGLWLKKGNASINTLIDLSMLSLDKIEEEDNYIKVGALVSLRQFETSPLIKEVFRGMLSNAVSQIMGPAFRECATIGGTVMGKFGFSDLLTALLATEAKLVFYPYKEITLEEFLNSPGACKDILTHVLIRKCHRLSYFKKVCLTALDYPIINVAITHCIRHDQYTIAVGSRAEVAVLAKEVMELVNNGEKDFAKASEEVSKLKFTDNLSAKADYREHLAKIYVRRGLEEVNK